ncbi:MAG: hypothetical protein KDA46_09995, partial [Parvularculaceae bacterium]|nr:hypothetical protein [Parvularculaceae bacterium]
AYPGKPGWISPESADVLQTASVRDDAADCLRRIADHLGAPDEPATRQPAFKPPRQGDQLDPATLAAVIANFMPEDAIVSDEAATAGLAIFPMTQGAPKHDWLTLTGGSIGQGLPLAAGAAIACPDRKVIALQADGSAMYTVQALWTMARENLDVTTVILNNGSYAILNIELARVGVTEPGPKALSLLDLTNPAINWASISEGMGVPAIRTDTAASFQKAFEEAMAHKGPRLIEAVLT